jgi:hypothetical protein
LKNTPRVSLAIRHLLSGGIITNYHCSSNCRHCLYKSGPGRSRHFLEPDTAAALLARIKLLGCRSVHIGGGEPLLNPATVAHTLRAARAAGVAVDYVETNSAWYTGPEKAAAILSRLKEAGLSALLVSISPFHNATIPFARVQGVLQACDQVGIATIPWIAGFAADLSALDTQRVHDLEAYTAHFGEAYLAEVMQRYWLHPGGRALDLYRAVTALKPVADILKQAPPSCYRDLADTSHFHVDPYGNYIPGLCAGLAIDFMDIGRALSIECYPLTALLAGAGVQGLYAYACEEHGFVPAQAGYANRCDLCNDIRRHLFVQGDERYPELGPPGYYHSS